MNEGVQTRNSPAYPAARKVAETVEAHFARRAAAARAASARRVKWPTTVSATLRAAG